MKKKNLKNACSRNQIRVQIKLFTSSFSKKKKKHFHAILHVHYLTLKLFFHFGIHQNNPLEEKKNLPYRKCITRPPSFVTNDHQSS